MFSSIWNTLVLLAAVLFQNAYAQQYAGDTIPNSLPSVPGSELVYFKIKDPAGVAKNLTLTNYYSLQQSGKRLVPSQIKRAFIIIHGLNRDPGTYMSNALSALSQVTSDSNINFSSVAIMAPYFPNGDDKNTGYPYVTTSPTTGKTLSGGKQSYTNALVWKGSQWSGGGTNQYPVAYPTVSTYNVLDQLIQYFNDKTMFPNLNQIVVAGHSLGGQTIQRYSAVGLTLSKLSVTTPVTYWIANPNSLAWLNSSRPLTTSGCPDYDAWREGLSNYTDYPMIYNTALVAKGSAAVIANYQTKNKAYARGTQDLGDDSSTCAPFTTGANRNERFFNFINWWQPTCEAGNSTSGHCDTVDLINAGHDGGAMMSSAAGQARLFTDNFYGDGARSYDFGYPREQAGDDPFPNPAYNSTVATVNATVYAGNMTTQGCYSDSGTRTLTTLAYDNSSNTIEMCTTQCYSLGYTIAGMEYGTQCWCGNTIGASAQKTLDAGCAQACAGNSSEVCGGGDRLSLYSASTPSQAAIAGNPEVVGNYFYLNCYSEATSGRALSATSYSDSKNMTLENCAAFCNGYQYFGIEYAGECYCGSYFGTGSTTVSDSTCSMTCTGNSLELCGGSGALSVYQLESSAVVSTKVQGSTTTTTGATNTGATGTTTTSAIPSSSLCPAVDGQTLTDSNGSNYTIHCSSDNSQGSYASANAANSYLDCMTWCDSASGSGCAGWTYVGGTNGSGSGTCWLKTGMGSYLSSGSNTISGAKVSSGTATTSGSSTATTSYANGATPVVAGVTYLIQTDTSYSGTLINLARRKRATASSLSTCLNTCASTTSCVGTAYNSNTTTCSFYSGIDSSSKVSTPGTDFATVESRSTSTSSSTTVSATSGVPSASLCPSAGGQTITDSNGNTYMVTCSSDSSVGSYTNAAASTSYLDCMIACDAASATGCQAFTYVGGSYGSGSGTCWLKTSIGTYSSAGANYIAAVKVSSGSSSSSASSTSSSVGSSISSSVTSSSVSASVTSSSSVSSTISSSTTTSSTTDSSSGVSSTSLCPSANGQTIIDANANSYKVTCSSDSDVGSYTNAQASTSYLDCMVACDNAASGGCTAFTYVGGAYGSGSGTCWLKTSLGNALSAGNNYIIAVKVSSGGSSSSSASTTSSASTSSASTSSSSVITSVSSTTSTSSTTTSATTTSSSGIPSASLCPASNGQTVVDSKGNGYKVTCSSDSDVGSYTNTQASTSYLDCMTACDTAFSSGGCTAFTYVGGSYGSGSGTCWLKTSLGNALSAGNNYIVAVRASTGSSSSSSSSSVSSSSVSSSSAVSSSTSSVSSSSVSSSSTVSSSTSSASSLTASSTASSSTTTSSTAASSTSSSNASSTTSSSTTASPSSTSSDKPTSSSSTVSSTTFSSSTVSSTTSSSSTVSSTTSSSSTVSSTTSSSSTVSSTISSSSTVSSTTSSSSTVSSTASSSSTSSSITSSTTTSSTSTKSSSTSTSSSSTSSAASLPSGVSSYGCYVDSSTRALSYSNGTSSTNTPSQCALNCRALGYKYAGTEYGSECWCSNTAPTTTATSTDCNMACSGDKSQTCGAGNRLTVTVDNTWTQKFFARTTYSTWNLMACYTDNSNGRLLSTSFTGSTVGGTSNMTVSNCLDACAKSGLKYCGAEYYYECYGGNTAPASSLVAGTDPLASGCNYACKGNSTEACGGSNKILVYVNNGTTSA